MCVCYHYYYSTGRLLLLSHWWLSGILLKITELAGTVVYTDCISVEGYPLFNECSGYDIKPSDGEAPVMLEIWEIWSTLSLTLHLGPLWPKVVVPDSPIYGSNKWFMLNWIIWNRTVWPFNCVLSNEWCLIELLIIHSNTWNHLTMCKTMSNIE